MAMEDVRSLFVEMECLMHKKMEIISNKLKNVMMEIIMILMDAIRLAK